jgi:hypothetical protein
MFSMDFTDLKDCMTLSKDALEILKSGLSFLPKGSQQRTDAEAALRAAGDVLARSDAKLAMDLGFPLCKCTFPGEPMLWKKDMQKSVCPKCGDVHPKDHPDVPPARFDSALTARLR